MPANFWDFAAERIARHAFRDIDDTYDEYSAGWVSIMNMFDSEFSYGSYAAGDYIAMSMRIDERKISSAVVKKLCMKEEERIKKERQIPKLSRGQRIEIKESITLMLTKKAVPVPAVYDLCWNLADNTVLFFSTSGAAQAALEELFKTSFDLHLVLQVPFLVAGNLIDQSLEQRLAALDASIFI